jgi:Leucine-rich repeat (LRR) protein
LNLVRTRPESSFDAKSVIGALNVASAIEAIKDHFNLTSWTGDPCVNTPYDWTICTTDPSPRITAVRLSNLNLTGSIPEALSNLSALSILWLDHNSLVGTIPESLSALTNLQSLRLNDNKITGSIPAWLTSLNLTNLDLSDNNLMGAIPSGLLHDRNLTYFNYSGNLCLGPNACTPSPAPVPTTGPSHKNKSNVPAIVGATIGGLLVVTVITLVLFRHYIFTHYYRDHYPITPPPGMCFLMF